VSKRQRRQQKLELFETVRQMKAAGLKVSEIARRLGVNRRRLDKWVGQEVLPERNRMAPRPGMAESFRGYLRQRWQAGFRHGRKLFAEIQQLGYGGSYSHLAELLSPWRLGPEGNAEENMAPPMVVVKRMELPAQPEVPATTRQISPQVASALLIKHSKELSSAQAEIVAVLKQQCPGFAAMRHLALSFRGILQSGKVATLHRWMEEVANSGIHALERFVRTLKQDLKAVEAAVSERWSNGPVEGQINRLKMLKRQMYGRAGIELLRARMLPEPMSSAIL
jgi:Transposase